MSTRNTSFEYIRDEWIRGIDLRGKRREFEDKKFKRVVDQFKTILSGRESVGKDKMLLLSKETTENLRVWVKKDAKISKTDSSGRKGGEMTLLSAIDDERINRLV